MENDYNIFGKSIRIMKLPLAELGTTTEAAVLEKMVGESVLLWVYRGAC